MAGAASVGRSLSKRLGLPVKIVGEPDAALNAGWAAELAAAMPTLTDLARQLDNVFRQGLAPLTVLSRCAAALATLPVLMRHRPDACVVWLDAHGDLNTPQTSLSGYLGGMSLAGPAGLWDSGLGQGLPMAAIVLVGARELDPAEQALVESGILKLVRCEGDYPVRLRSAIAGRPVYVHLDCDVLDPGIVPTDYRVPAGLSLAALHGICEILAGSEVVGLEIAEFENAWGAGTAEVSPDPLLDALDPLTSRLGVRR
jgi:arginase family enzyme